MTNEEAKHKLVFLKKAYQKLNDEKVDSGKLVGDGVRGDWEAETPLDEVYKDMIESLDFVIKVLEQQPSEDCISRTELLSRIDAERKHLLDLKMDGAEHIIVHHARRIIEDMPSVTPQPGTGRWMRKTKVDGVYDISGVKTFGIKCQCDRCDFTTTVIEDFGYYSYCPNCGVKMEVEE